MKIPISILLTSTLASAGMIPLGEHLDHRWTWNAGEEKWELELRGDTAGYSAEEAFLPLSDRAFVPNQLAISGARVVQPANGTNSFTGVTPGENIWLAFAGFAIPGEAYPGFANGQLSSDFGAYRETDRRLSQPQADAVAWITTQISSVYHDGRQPPIFSMYDFVDGGARVWASTNNGQTDNLFLFRVGGHTHLNWAFGATGIYRIGMRTSAFLGPGKTNSTGLSDEEKVTFAVGPVAYWQCLNFDANVLEMPDVIGMEADPDHDGEKNIVEYAFGTDPNGTATPLSPGLGGPVSYLENTSEGTFQVIAFPRRKALQLTNPLIYTPQFSDDLSENSWSETGTETVSGFEVDETALNAEWEKVEFRREVTGASAERSFARVKVAFTD